MKNKLNLQDLRIKSFTTSVVKQEKIIGGSGYHCSAAMTGVCHDNKPSGSGCIQCSSVGGDC